MTSPAVTRTALRRCAELSEMDDVGLGARFLAQQPMHADRSPEVLRRWAGVALAAGQETAGHVTDADATADEQGLTVVSEGTGLRPGWVVVAEYVERRREVRIHPDVLELAERLVQRLGWERWYPPGALRSAALAHELGHRRLHGATARELRAAMGLRTLQWGRYRRYGHVAGSPELFAHGYAHTACGLGRSPLLLTFALVTVARAGTGKDAA